MDRCEESAYPNSEGKRLEIVAGKKCLHCLKTCPTSSPFCCAGCATAYKIITGSGFSEFYERRGSGSLSPISQASPSSAFSDLEYLKTVATIGPDGKYRIELYLENISCSACGWLIERAPFLESKVLNSRFHFGKDTVTVAVEKLEDVSAVAACFSKLGYPPHLVDSKDLQSAEMRKWMIRTGVAFASALGTMHVSLNLYAGHLTEMSKSLVTQIGLLSFVLALPALGFSAIPFYRGALSGIRMKRITMDVLVSLSIVVGFAFSAVNLILGKNEFFFDSLSMLICLLLFGRLIVKFSENKLLMSTEQLLMESLGSKTYSKGESIEILPGQNIPVDGQIEAGKSEVSTSWLNGEQAPKLLSPPMKVLAGSYNFTAPLRITVQAAGRQTELGKMLLAFDGIEKSQPRQDLQKIETRFSTVLLFAWLAYLTFETVTGTLNASQLTAFLLVICPCSLGLASPIAAVVAWSQGFKSGVWMKDPWILLKGSQITTLVFDKTGTLTQNRPTVILENWIEKSTLNLGILGHLCRGAAHPVLNAISDFVPATMELSAPVKQVVGEGVFVNIDSHDYFLGKAEENSLALTKISFSRDGEPLAFFWIKHDLKENAQDALKSLGKKYELFLISGDNRQSVESVGDILGFSKNKIFSEKTPNDKINLVEDLQEKGRRVMMIGDGLNDTLAIKRSFVSGLMGGGFSRALEGSDVYFSKGNVESVQTFLRASAKLQKVIHTNYVWSGVYNLVGVGLVIFGIVGPIACAIMMPLSSLTVLLISTQRKYF